MKNIKDLFEEQLNWASSRDNIPYFVTESYDKSICWLRMNDFPEEPLWTFVRGIAVFLQCVK